jgi:hypothetical protein
MGRGSEIEKQTGDKVEPEIETVGVFQLPIARLLLSIVQQLPQIYRPFVQSYFVFHRFIYYSQDKGP